MDIKNKLQWEDKYSVGVKIIDEQHQKMFTVINNLIDIIQNTPTKEDLTGVITSLIEYKKYHFDTEEKYFKEFNYEGTEEHVAAHHTFEEKIKNIEEKNGNNTISLAYDLVDFLEDWLVDHLQTLDQKYKECFLKNGLK